MKMNDLIILLLCSKLTACVEPIAFKGNDYAHIKSNYPIISVNGEQHEPVYALDIKAGQNVLVIVYHTYRFEYACTFSWEAVAGTAYEVTDLDHKNPLTLYRWEPTNQYWASRFDPTEPVKCIQKETK